MVIAGAVMPCRPQTTQTEKPALSKRDLEKHVHYFDVENGKLTGDGARFLIDEIARSQYVLLGEYHGSLRISQFTKAVVSAFHDAGCRTFALEIGPVSAEILSELSTDPDRALNRLKVLNSEYSVVTPSRTFTPIPFFSNVEDGEFLIEARKRKWDLLGLDQEFSFGYLPLFERIYKNLKPGKKRELKQLYEQVKVSIKSFYEADIKDRKSQYKAILESKEVDAFLESAADDPKNKRIADAIRFTTEVYHLNDDKIRKYYEANSRRVNYMKANLAEGFERLKFDLKKDKMLLKMGAVHTGRGFSDLSLFEIGNTLSELAAFHGNRSLHVEFGSRHYIDKGNEVDALDNKSGFLYRYQALLQMGRKDKWTVIDLRSLRQNVFYRRQFKLDPIVLEIFKNQDLYVIPPIEKEPTPNFSSNSGDRTPPKTE